MEVRVTGPKLTDRECWVLVGLKRVLDEGMFQTTQNGAVRVQLRDLVKACCATEVRGYRYLVLEDEIMCLLLRLGGLRHWVSVGRTSNGRWAELERRVGPLVRVRKNPRVSLDDDDDYRGRGVGWRCVEVEFPSLAGGINGSRVIMEAVRGCGRRRSGWQKTGG